MMVDDLEELIETIENELRNSYEPTYRTKEGFNIVTDVGFVRQWFNIYKHVLRERYGYNVDGGTK